MTRLRTIASLAAAGALLAASAAGQASHKGEPHGKGKAKSNAKSDKRCAKAPKVGFSVKGTLVSFTADDSATPANEATVTLKVTDANGHATRSGDVTEGSDFTLTAADDAFDVKLDGFEGTDTPSVGDQVKVSGKIARKKEKCVAEGTSTADRYGTADVRRVTVSNGDGDSD